MSYRLDKKNKKRNGIILGIIILIFVFFMFKEGKFGFASRLLTQTAAPVWKSEIAFTDIFLKQVFTSKKDLLKQNIMLKARVEEDEIAMSKLKLIEDENESLKKIFLRSVGDDNLLATILVKPNQSLYGALIIDAGEADGVKPEDLVFANGDVVIGEVESVEKNTSKVVLYSSPGYISQVTLQNTGRYFNAKGRGGGDFEISFPRDLEVEVGEILVYPSINNYIVGVVEKVIFDPRDSFKKVLFRSAVNLQELKWVQVKI